jgi:hypothetical protein
MAKPTRGFLGRGKAPDILASRLVSMTQETDAGDQWPILNAEVTPPPGRGVVVVLGREPRRASDLLDMGRDPRSAGVRLFR